MNFEHLHQKNISYTEHAKQSLWISWQLLKCIPKSIIHSIYPDWYINDVSESCKMILNEINIE